MGKKKSGDKTSAQGDAPAGVSGAAPPSAKRKTGPNAARDILGGKLERAAAAAGTVEFAAARPPASDEAAFREKCSDYGAGKIDICRQACPWDAAPTLDDDFARNCAMISDNHLQIGTMEFDEGGLHWILQIGRNPKKTEGPLWFVPHDNENVGFDSAIYGLATYGGKLLKVQTKGQRLNSGQDPNRNFQTPNAARCKDQLALSPLYTKAVLSQWDGRHPIVALHSNKPGGSISVKTKWPDAIAYRGVPEGRRKPISLFRPDNTLVFLSAPNKSVRTDGFRTALTKAGVNVIMERVDMSNNDCSLSNFAVLQGIENYFNIEVGNAPRERDSLSERAQKAILDIIVKLPDLNNEADVRKS